MRCVVTANLGADLCAEKHTGQNIGDRHLKRFSHSAEAVLDIGIGYAFCAGLRHQKSQCNAHKDHDQRASDDDCRHRLCRIGLEYGINAQKHRRNKQGNDAASGFKAAEHASLLIRCRNHVDALDGCRPEGQNRCNAKQRIDEQQRCVARPGRQPQSKRTRRYHREHHKLLWIKAVSHPAAGNVQQEVCNAIYRGKHTVFFVLTDQIHCFLQRNIKRIAKIGQNIDRSQRQHHQDQHNDLFALYICFSHILSPFVFLSV